MKRRDQAHVKEKTSLCSRSNEFVNKKGNADLFRKPGTTYSEESLMVNGVKSYNALKMKKQIKSCAMSK